MWTILGNIICQATLTDWVLFVGSILVVLYIYGTWTYDTFARKGLASMHPKIPFLGNSDLLVLFSKKSFSDLVDGLYNNGKGHSIFGFYEFRTPIYMVRGPEILKVITVKEFDAFTNHRPAVSEKSDRVFGKNLFFLKDQRWRSMRATMSPAFTTSKMKNMFPLISQCGQQMAEHLREKYAAITQDSGNNKMPTDMKDLFSRMANDVIATTAFGLSCDSLKQAENEFYRMGKAVTTFTSWQTFVFMLSILFPKFVEIIKPSVLNVKAVKFFESLVHDTIKEREKRGIFRPDILQLLMQARVGELKTEGSDAHEEEKIKAEKAKLDDEDVTAQAIIFFFAGFETVSTALCFASYALSLNPEAQKKLQAEVDTIMKEKAGKLSYEDIQGMKYLDMVVNETLRMYPPVIAVDRECRKTVTLPATNDSPAFTVHAGSIMWIPTYGIHLDPGYWPEPHKFDPERFSDENKHKIIPFTYLPFGLGPRLCVGQRFALLEVKIALVHLIANFELHQSPKLKLPLKYENGFNAMIKGGFWCDLVPRDVKHTQE